MADLLDVFSYAFMQRALLAGAAIAVMVGMLGTFVVQRGLAFLGDGLAHASFGGIAFGAFVAHTAGGAGWLEHPLALALPFTFLVAVGIAFLRDRTGLSSDTAIGVFFAVSVALGIVFLALVPPDANVVDLRHLLFGSILSVGPADLRIILVTAALATLGIAALWGRLAYATFDAELARTDGVRTRALEYALFGLAAVVVVVSARVVGVVLLASYLVIPAAGARLVAGSLARMTALAMALGLLGTLVGLVLSYLFDVPSGATIILVQAGLFGACALAGSRASR